MKPLRKIIAEIKDNAEQSRHWINKNFKVAEAGKFSLITIDEKYFKLFPGPEFSSELYRGQTTFYEQCTPSLYRNKNQIERFIAKLRTATFNFLLKNHPAVMDIKQLRIGNRKLKLDFEGMAQHYGLSTGLLDFTSDLDIAIFFATNDFIEDKNIFNPVLDKKRVGIIYKYNSIFDSIDENINPNYDTIGLQPLPRPGIQNAYSYRLTKNKNLNKQANIEKIKFYHDPEISRYYSDKYLNGQKLFPKEVIDEKLNYLKSTKCFSQKSFNIVYENNHSIPRQKILGKLDKLGYKIGEKYECTFSDEELLKLKKQWNYDKDIFLSKISLRFCIYPK